ncbi:hypothetical protein PCANC_19050 [Puccinia coronata f. sp. avenae]|uniref:Uncharacterized protein n=1 Tax=Puccinia coronata f. sp. avenae TaxID=200324 RepID=A0A2N5UCY5_9BASI|nr:hypothetical protein PCANC_19050 [Puccinia coronata f. sp. avenae]
MRDEVQEGRFEKITEGKVPSASAPRPKPGWDYMLAPNLAPRDINGNIDPSNILQHKRRAAIAIAFVASEVPKTYREAMQSPKAKQWLEAIQAELGAMAANKLWKTVHLHMHQQDEQLLYELS